VERFLQDNAPAQIEEALNERVIGQPQLTKAVADFLYYHALRQVHPQLPPRPMLISGPSGSGKTEVWRVAKKLYGDLFPMEIIDGSALTCDGWAGSQKLPTYITPQMAKGGIVVVDEFDKLTVPRISSSGSNVSREMQSQFLKLMDGEYHIIQNRKDTGITSHAMGFVMVGAFEALRGQKTAPAPKRVAPIGFCPVPQQAAPAVEVPVAAELRDEDFIRYGIMPEIVGRIATKCATAPLSQEACLGIIRGPHSRIAVLADVLKGYGVEERELISDEEILSLLRTARSNQTGFRWVSAQVENRMLERIRQGIRTLDKAS
jgi:ATP-dependent Clp protease ATP-binding subunit ClpX